MLNTLYHLEGYIIAHKDVLQYLDNYLELKKADANAGLIAIPEYNKSIELVGELKTYFSDVKENYENILSKQRNRIREY
jgi:hypothetical protein